MLNEKKYQAFQEKYFQLVKKCLPMPEERKKHIELVDFGLSDPTGNTFEKIGLGVEVLVNKILPQGGYCGKVLLWLPGQFMPEHRHQTVYILSKKVGIPCGLVKIKERVKDFKPLSTYSEEEYNYLVQIDEKAEINSLLPFLKEDGEIRIGKTETFWCLYGSAWLFIPPGEGEEVSAPDQLARVPSEQHQYITPSHQIHLTPYQLCTIPTNTPHSIVAGEEGFIAVEFSTPSWDAADVFTDPQIRRETLIEVEKEGKKEVITATTYFEKQGLKLQG
jgi:D-lyxose ketol-isomerase